MTYTNLLTSGRLNTYLADIDKQAEDMFCRLVNQMVEREVVTEELKAKDQISWVRAMNSIRNRATEIVNSNLIFLRNSDVIFQRRFCTKQEAHYIVQKQQNQSYILMIVKTI